ncbi:MAG: zinc-binding dehydrogenase [Caulobacter sp.]
MTQDPVRGLAMRSLVTEDGQLRVYLEETAFRAPEEGELLVRVEASPVNPSDLGMMLGPAHTARFETVADAGRPEVAAQIPATHMAGVASRIGQPLPVGNEGAGTVVAAGAGAEAYLGKTVAMLGGSMYAQYRLIKAREVMVLPEGASAADGASCFVNPLTALGMVETMRAEGHTALVHTAAASNLGQMLNRICLKDGVSLVNVVRSPAQAAILKGEGARWVVDSSAPDFQAALTDAIAEAGATIAFDAIGGGEMAGAILKAMEAALMRGAGEYARYGSPVHKQVYLYGGLDTRPTVIDRTFGMSWGVGGWLLTWFMQKAGAQTAQRLRQRVMDELKTTFASHYTAELSLSEMVTPDAIAGFVRKATGEKYLINPARG